MQEIVVSVDIETSPAEEFKDYEESALDHHRNRIDLIAVCDGLGRKLCFRSCSGLASYVSSLEARPRFVGQGFKFDLKTLKTKGIELPYEEDTLLQAVAYTHKIPESWLKDYEAERQKINKELGGVKQVHRQAGKYSLKTMAPYFLGVDPFWETADHNNEEYALKDADYTLRLWNYFNDKLKEEGTYSFYKDKLIPWNRMLMRAELRGIKLDLETLAKEEAQAAYRAGVSEGKLREYWVDAQNEWNNIQRQKVHDHYKGLWLAASSKAKDKAKCEERYKKLRHAALEKLDTKLNFSSPAQLMWVLRDYKKLDVETFEEEESTGKSVLNRLAAEGHKDVEELLEFRKQSKLCSAFFPSYREMQWEGRIHTNFNLDIARTGRTSSNGPNLQQVPGELHKLFIAGKGRKLVCYDLAGIEPVVMAYITECPILCSLLVSGRNFHDANTKIFLGLDCPDSEIKKVYKKERDLSKEVGLSLLYGAGPRRLQESAQKRGFSWSFAECKDKHRRFKEEYQHIYTYKAELDRFLEEGGTKENILGRQYRIDSPEDVYMKGLNTLIQGSASDLLLHCIHHVAEQFKGEDVYPVLFVHDEVAIDTPEHLAKDVEKALLDKLASLKLDTPYGRLNVTAEGGIYDLWKK